MERVNDRIYIDLVNGVVAVDATTREEAKQIALAYLRENDIPNLYGMSIDDDNEILPLDFDEDEADLLLHHDEDGSLMANATEDLRAETAYRLISRWASLLDGLGV